MDPIRNIFDEADRGHGPIRVARCHELGASKTQINVRAREGYVFHRTGRLPLDEIVDVEGIPTTDPVRSFLDVCDTHPGLASYAYARGYKAEKLNRELIEARIERESRQGRGGLTRAREIVTETSLDAIPGASAAEDEVYAWIRDAGFPLPERNVQVPSSFGWMWEVDLLYRRKPPVAVEVSPWGTHHPPWVYDKDFKKMNDLMAQGYRYLIVSHPSQRDNFLTALAHALREA